MVIDARGQYKHAPLTHTLPTLGVLPYRFVRTEADILRVLAGGTDDFGWLYSALNRNA